MYPENEMEKLTKNNRGDFTLFIKQFTQPQNIPCSPKDVSFHTRHII